MMQEKAAELLGLPDLPEALDRLRKTRLALEDMEFVIDFGNAHPTFLQILAKTMAVYELDYSRTVIVSHGFEGFNRVRNGQFCYFFVKQPTLLPILDRYIRTAEFPGNLYGSFTYNQCYYYRAAIFYFLYHAMKEQLDHWLSQEKRHVQFYQNGSPAGFLRDTARIVGYTK